MVKKLALIAAILIAAVNLGFSAKSLTGVGIYGNVMMGSGSGALGTGLGLTAKFGNFPVIGAEWNFGKDTSRIAGSVDYWVINSHLTGNLDYYIGLGAYAGLALGSNSAFDIGGRIPIGIQFWPVDKFEVFAELAPLVGFLPSLGIGGAFRLGMRVHF